MHQKALTLLSLLIALLAGLATSLGIFSDNGPGPTEHETVRGKTITLYGFGIYRHMSAEVAPQGIAQDYVTLFLGIPLLLIALAWARKGSTKGRFLLAGTLGYFFVTYLFYLVMAMYNELFLVYVSLLTCTFFALSLTLLSFVPAQLPAAFHSRSPIRAAGGFLLFSSIAIAFLWLGIVFPPLLSGTVIPPEVEHYTTLVVQGLDLGLLLPLAFVSGLLLLRKKPLGFLLAPVYLIFLAFLMTALTAKVVAMGFLGYNIIPVIFIIPVFNIISIGLAALMLKNIQD